MRYDFRLSVAKFLAGFSGDGLNEKRTGDQVVALVEFPE
jgi:hypothetical protein